VKKQEVIGGRFWLRLIGLLLGCGILIWVGIEDLSELGVLVFSGAICSWTAARLLITTSPDNKQLILRYILVGAGAGLVVAPLAVILMAFKSGVHGHAVPDFTVDQMWTVLSRAPYFILGGLLMSLGIGIWGLARKEISNTEA
jgi:hypothetical protein